jgi:ankyrin repeat protein
MTTTVLSAEDKHARMGQERAFLTKLLESALQGDFDRLKTAVEDYCRQHSSVTETDVLTQFRDGTRRTALHFACQSVPTQNDPSDQDIVEKILLSKWLPAASVQAMLRIKDKDGLTPLMLAAQLDHPELVERRVATILQVGSMAPSSASASSALSASSKLALARSKAGATPLHYAAGVGTTQKVIKMLHEAGHVALSTCSLQGGTPLHWAVARPPPNDSTETIRALIDCGADMNASNTDAAQFFPPPLVMAIAAGNDRHGKCLVDAVKERGIDLRPTRDFSLPGNVTVFHMAADMNLVGTLALLLEQVDDRSQVLAKKNNEGLSPLDLAAREGHVGCVLLLLPDDNNRTEEAAKAYIAKVKANPNVTDNVQASGPDPKDSLVAEKSDEATDAYAPSKRLEEEAMQKAAEISATAADVSDEQKLIAKEIKGHGNTYFAASEWQEALKSYSEAIATDPTDATFYSNRSACFMHLGKPDEALSDAMICRCLRPDWPKAAYRMAMARLELGRYEDAAVSAWEGLQQDEKNEELQFLLQKCVRKGRQDHKEAHKK